jgi:hypothetical protein
MPMYYVVYQDTGVLFYDRGFATLFDVMEHFICNAQSTPDEIDNFISMGVDTFCNSFMTSIGLQVTNLRLNSNALENSL